MGKTFFFLCSFTFIFTYPLCTLWHIRPLHICANRPCHLLLLSHHSAISILHLSFYLHCPFLFPSGVHVNATPQMLSCPVLSTCSMNIHYLPIFFRDLMKWCNRISTDFDVAKSATSNMVFQEALDCFCACLSKPQTRVLLAIAMGAKLNISKEQASIVFLVLFFSTCSSL